MTGVVAPQQLDASALCLDGPAVGGVERGVALRLLGLVHPAAQLGERGLGPVAPPDGGGEVRLDPVDRGVIGASSARLRSATGRSTAAAVAEAEAVYRVAATARLPAGASSHAFDQSYGTSTGCEGRLCRRRDAKGWCDG